MSNSGRRVRVITDPEKYRRHRRRKVVRRLVRWLAWAALLIAAMAILWLLLDRMLQPPPQA